MHFVATYCYIVNLQWHHQQHVLLNISPQDALFDGTHNIVTGTKSRTNNLSNFVWLSHTRNTIACHDRTRYKYLGFCLLESCMILVICIFKVDRHTSALFAGSIKNHFFKYDFAKMRLTLAFSYFIWFFVRFNRNQNNRFWLLQSKHFGINWCIM